MLAAVKLVDEKGYRNTSIEEIAERAEVGPATIYNYFGTKAGMFLSLFQEITEEMLDKGEKAMEHLPDEPEDAVCYMIDAYFKDVAGLYSRHLMREVFVMVLVEQLSFRQEIMGMDYRLMGQLATILVPMQQQGKIRADVGMEDAGLLIYSAIMVNIMAFVMNDDMTAKECLRSVKNHIRLLFKGLK